MGDQLLGRMPRNPSYIIATGRDGIHKEGKLVAGARKLMFWGMGKGGTSNPNIKEGRTRGCSGKLRQKHLNDGHIITLPMGHAQPKLPL